MPTDPDTGARHETEIQRLWDRVHHITKDVANRETRIVAVERDLVALGDSIPEDLGAKIGRMDEKMTNLQVSVGDIVEALKRGYVTVAEFDPVKRVVYGLVTVILISVAGAVLALVLSKGV